MLHFETVSPHLENVLKQLTQLPELYGFRLVGGTALSLQIGHRSSVDIDLFSSFSFDPVDLYRQLARQFNSFELNWSNANGFTSTIMNVKVDIFNWNVPFNKPAIIEAGISLLDEREIGAMKLDTITSRKEKKDFIDIAFLLKRYTLSQLIFEFKLKYPYMNQRFVLDSLLAIDHADSSADPIMIIPCTWYETKAIIISSVENYYHNKKNEIELAQQDRMKKAEDLIAKKKGIEN